MIGNQHWALLLVMALVGVTPKATLGQEAAVLRTS